MEWRYDYVNGLLYELNTGSEELSLSLNGQMIMLSVTFPNQDSLMISARYNRDNWELTTLKSHLSGLQRVDLDHDFYPTELVAQKKYYQETPGLNNAERTLADIVFREIDLVF